MIKKNIGKLFLSSFVILLPIAAGLILWNKLPGVIVSHWNAQGEADGFADKSLAVFGIPLIFLAMQWLCVLFSAADPKNKNQNSKVFSIVIWLMPLLSLVVSAVMYCIALGVELDIGTIITAAMGVLFIIIGNYLPKCKANYTIGIRVPWTINDEEIWNKTHRFAGWFWVIGGVLLIAASLLPAKWKFAFLIVIVLLLALIPTIYSYILYRKKGVKITLKKDKKTSLFIILSLILTAILLIAISVIMFTGDIEVEFKEEAFAVKTAYWSDIEVNYDSIDSVELRESFNGGERTGGFGSARLLLGTFRNEEFGYYTRYTYTGNNGFIVLNADGKMLVLGCEDMSSTEELYRKLSEKIG